MSKVNKQGLDPKRAAAVREKAMAKAKQMAKPKGLDPKRAAAVRKTAMAKAKQMSKKVGGKTLGAAGAVMDIANMTAKDREASKAAARRKAAGIPDA
jgi:hypothetical protein